MKKISTVIIIGLLSFSMFSILAPQAKATSLPPVGYWKFDEGSGNVAYDSSGMENDGLINGAEWVNGISDSALRFRNSTTYVTMTRFPDGLEGNVEFTVSLWIKVITWPSAEQQFSYLIIFGKPVLDQAFHILLDNVTRWGNYRTIRAGFWEREVPSQHTFTTGVWYNWAFVYDKTTVKMYQNGTFLEDISLGGASPNLNPVDSSNRFGLDPPPGPDYQSLDGIMDEIAIYNYARTPEEIWNDFAGGLVGYWKFDEGSGNVAHDSSVNSIDGTIYDATWTTGKLGSALSFDGINDYVEIPQSSALNFSSSVSIEAWIKVDGATGDYQVIVAKWYPGGNLAGSYVLEFQPDGMTPQFVLRTTGRVDTVSSVLVPFGSWAHIAGTYDGLVAKIYVNGALAGSQSVTGAITIGNQLYIGAHSPVQPADRNWFNGVIDEVAIYDYARTAEEIWNDYMLGANQPPVADFRYRGPEKTSFTPSTIYVGSEVKFDAEPSYDLDGPNQNPVSYTWDYGDGSDLLTTTEEVSYHTYVVSGPYTVALTVTDDKGASDEISQDIFIYPLQWELFIEIDYMLGHRPTDSVLDYIHGYFRDNGVNIVFYVDDEIQTADITVTDSVFWAFELGYNDVFWYDDQAQDGVDTDGIGGDKEYTLKEKWVLFGTVSAENPQAAGYTIFSDTTARNWKTSVGNYIFIADQANDEWAKEPEQITLVSPEDAETVALMHEIGHSIGILKLDQEGEEKYDSWKSDSSVMAKLNVANCTIKQYSPSYWKENNLDDYYTI